MDDEERKAFGREIRALRANKGWTQGELAKRAGVAKKTVFNLENGLVELQPGNLGKVLDVLEYRREVKPWSREVEGFLQMVGFRLSQMPADEQVERINHITKYMLFGGSADAVAER